MSQEREKLIKAKKIMVMMANGCNPLSGEDIEEESFVTDPRMSRCFFFISEVLQKALQDRTQKNASTMTEFVITPEEKSQIIFPAGNIGVSEFARCVNTVINLNKSKRLSGVELNKQLKKMGLLSEEKTENGRTRTIINDKSKEYGIETETRNYDGNEYEKVVFNDIGRKFLLENLEKIMAFEK